jgi:endo-1,4-beta-mannosidase
MWQAATWDPKRIDLELGWAEGLGMNTMRVFLHNIPWQQDRKGFLNRMDQFLAICDKHHIKPLFVLFDSVWDPNPHPGPQPAPRPGVHNSRWVQCPGAKMLENPKDYPKLAAYVKGVVGRFAKDPRVLGWDIWNEPDNTNGSSYGKEEPANKVDLVLKLLPQAFGWARSVHPQQPLTSGVWQGDWSNPDKLSPMAKEQLELSDVESFHNYENAASFRMHVQWLQQYGRPIICTEYMARPVNSTFENILPVAKEMKVGAINWGFVQGKSQTFLPWDSWQHPYVDRQPEEWFHDIFRKDGEPYNPKEVEFIKKMTGVSGS